MQVVKALTRLRGYTGLSEPLQLTYANHAHVMQIGHGWGLLASEGMGQVKWWTDSKNMETDVCVGKEKNPKQINGFD